MTRVFKTLLIFWVVTSVLPAHAQYYNQRSKVDPDDKALANRFKKQYDDAEFGASLIDLSYEFYVSKENPNLLAVSEKSEEEFIALQDNKRFPRVLFYSDQSEVYNFKEFQGRRAVRITPILTNYESDGIFHSDVKMAIFSFSLDKIGEKTGFSYQKETKDAKYLTRIFPNERFPVKSKKITFSIPKWADVELLEVNFEGVKKNKERRVDPKTGNLIYTYTFTDLKPFSNDDNAPSAAEEYPHLLVLSKSFSVDGRKVELFSGTQDLYNWYKKLVDEIDDSKSGIPELAAQLTKDAKNDMEAISNIFYWVQDNIRYIAFENGIMGFKPESSEQVLKNRYGDCKGMANLTKQLLVEAGYDARLTWLGTRGIPYDYSIPSLAVDNHMICSVVHNDSTYFLDATEEFISMDQYAYRIQGRPVLIENGNDYILKNIPETDYKENQILREFEFELIGDALVGSVQYELNGEAKVVIRRVLNEVSASDKGDFVDYFITRGNKNYSISDISHSDFEERQGKVKFDYNLSLNNQILRLGDEIYLSLAIDKRFEGFEFKERESDYKFDRKIYYTSNAKLLIPEGYQVSYMPDSINVEEPNFQFNLSYEQIGNEVIYKSNIIVYDGEVPSEDFVKWDEVISRLGEFYNDQIILVKQ